MIKQLSIRTKRFIKNNLLIIPNLLKGNRSIKKYVLINYLHNNLDFVSIGFIKKWIQEYKLKLRFKKMNHNSNLEHISVHKTDDLFDIIYINLTHRTDRKKQLIEEFGKIGINNLNRFDAVKNSNGALGCAISHKSILKDYHLDKHRLLMICEDDVSFFGSYDTLMLLIESFINDANLDVLCLGFNNSNKNPYNDYFYLTSDTQTMSCYILKPYMKEIMLKNFEMSVQLIELDINSIYKPEIDQVWKLLQKDFNFVIPKIRFAYQRESYSDIEKKVVSYNL